MFILESWWGWMLVRDIPEYLRKICSFPVCLQYAAINAIKRLSGKALGGRL